MNIDRLITMALRRFMNRGISMGIGKGSDYLAGRGKRTEDMTPQERAQAQGMRKQAQSLRRMMRLGRRMR